MSGNFVICLTITAICLVMLTTVKAVFVQADRKINELLSNFYGIMWPIETFLGHYISDISLFSSQHTSIMMFIMKVTMIRDDLKV